MFNRSYNQSKYIAQCIEDYQNIEGRTQAAAEYIASQMRKNKSERLAAVVQNRSAYKKIYFNNPNYFRILSSIDGLMVLHEGLLTAYQALKLNIDHLDELCSRNGRTLLRQERVTDELLNSINNTSIGKFKQIVASPNSTDQAPEAQAPTVGLKK